MHYIIEVNALGQPSDEKQKVKNVLQKFGISFEEILVLPFVDDYKFATDRKDVFVLGGVKLAKIATQQDWKPGSLFGNNHNYEIYSQHYKEHLLNWDSKVFNLGEIQKYEGFRFVRPCLDSKLFNGAVYYCDDWDYIQEGLIREGYSLDTRIQMASVKQVYREVRLFIVNGKVITGSQYTFGGRYLPSTFIGDEILEFANKMIEIYQVAECFVMDIAETDIGLKIVEVNCINCSGFYQSDVMKLIIALEDFYN